MTTEYMDWSDLAMLKYDTKESKTKYADCDLWMESDNLMISLKRKTKNKKDFTIILDAKTVFEFLKEYLDEQ